MQNDTLAKNFYFPFGKKLLAAAVTHGITLTMGMNGIPLALLVSNTFTTLIDTVYRDFELRFLSRRERFKTDLVFVTALKEIESRIDGGASLREDGFFTDVVDGRTKAEEILEGVLLKARNQYEEKKIPHFGMFWASLAYSDVSSALANYFLKAAESVSYRQFLLLAQISKVKVFEGEPLRGRRHRLAELDAFVAEEMMLAPKAEFGGIGLLEARGSYNSELSSMGMKFVELFGINKISSYELLEIKRLIARCEEDPTV